MSKLPIEKSFYVIIEKSLDDPINGDQVIGVCNTQYDAQTYLTPSRRIVGPVPLLFGATNVPKFHSAHFAHEDFEEADIANDIAISVKLPVSQYPHEINQTKQYVRTHVFPYAIPGASNVQIDFNTTSTSNKYFHQ